MKDIEIWTDGACKGNPDGDGGWCALLKFGEFVKTFSGGEAHTTNQRMELMAAIGGLKALKEPCGVTLYSDSAYLINAYNDRWLSKWKAFGWHRDKAGKEEVKNLDLWQALDAEVQKHIVNFVHVKGHSDNQNNNICDKIAVEEAAKIAAARKA
ncbi:MAG: ribonuclease HI [Christensenellaceae bacterium]|jgi:ribonuclease HI|nr:ribonuclease HI [Christensenellaceae bacterium]